MPNPFNLLELAANLQVMKRELPILLANQAQRYFADSWKQQGYEGKQWKEVKRREEGTKEYKYPKYKGLSRRTNPILVRSGALRREVSNSIRSQSFDLIKLVSSLPYSSYINEGTPTMDARPFMRDSPGLRVKQTELITKTVNRALKIT